MESTSFPLPSRCAAAVFILAAAFMVSCTETVPEPDRLIRLAEPVRIESVESEHMDILAGGREALCRSHSTTILDRETEWYPFHTAVELEGASPAAAAGTSSFTGFREGDMLRLPAGTGIAFPYPLKASGSVKVTFKGRFGSEDGCTAAVIELSSVPKPSRIYIPGILKKGISAFGVGTHRVEASGDGQLADLLWDVKPEARCLLIMVTAMDRKEGLLEWVRITELLPVGERFFRQRMREGIAHPAVATSPLLGGVVRPSLFLVPGTTVRLKTIVIPRSSEFRCALGTTGTEGVRSVEISAMGIEPDGNGHELFRERIGPDPGGWWEVSRDLAHLEGHRLKIEVACRYAGGLEDTEPLGGFPEFRDPPLVFCGSPMIHALEPSPDPLPLNLLVISLDTLRPDHLGCYGYGRPVSPCIDAVARSGVLFRNAYAQAPYTLASHASLFTALNPTAHGLLNNQDLLAGDAVLLAQVLAGQGWATAAFNNGGWISHEFGMHKGFDLYCEVDPIGDRYLDGRPVSLNRMPDGSAGSLYLALEWVDRHRREPFFLFLHTFMVHDYLPPRRLAESFNAGNRSGLEPGLEARQRIGEEIFEIRGLSPEENRFFINMYDATICEADDMVKEVLDHLRMSGLLERTVLVITSDHGEEFLEHGNFGHVKSVYEELIRIPLILWKPGMKECVDVETIVNQVDIMPTLLDWLGIEKPDTVLGRSLLPVIEGRERGDRPVIAEVELPGYSIRRCMIEKGWKFIEGGTDPSLKHPAPAERELYDLDSDPGERLDLFDADPDRGGAMESRWLNIFSELQRIHEMLDKGGTGTHSISEELKEVLKQQGYL